MAQDAPDARALQRWASSDSPWSRRRAGSLALPALVVGIVAAGLVGPLPLRGQTVTLPAAGDTYLKSGSPNQNQGQESILRLQSSGTNRAFVRFDEAAILSAVGAGSLASARLELFIATNANNWGSDGRTVDAHRIIEPWSELGATWNCGIDSNPSNGGADCASPWGGGHFQEEPTDTVLHTNGLTGWISFEVTVDVATLLAGDHLEGWIVKKTEEAQTGRVDYVSREGGGGYAPRLVLVIESAEHDGVSPRLAITSPAQPVIVNQPAPTLRVEYSDGGSGVDPGSLQVLLDTEDVTASCSLGQTAATCSPGTIQSGPHGLEARVRDYAGNLATASFNFELLTGPGLHTVYIPLAADTYLRQGSPNQNQGSDARIRLQQSGKNRGLVGVDSAEVAALLAGATVRSAQLELYVADNGNNWGSSGRTVDLHRLLAPWSEAGATWNCAEDSDLGNQQADCSSQWSGGSFDTTALQSLVIVNGLMGWVDLDVTCDLAAMAGGAVHHGWLLKKTSEGQSGRVEFAAQESPAGQRPSVRVVFETSGGGDSGAPTIGGFSPPGGSFLSTSTPTVSATYGDDGSGIDPASGRLTVDGVNRTSEAQFSASGVIWTPLVALGDGVHFVLLAVRDTAGNEAQAGWGFTVDATPPTLSLTAPEGTVTSNVARVKVSLILSDATSGLDWSSSSVQVDGTEIAPSCSLDSGSARCVFSPLSPGTHEVVATIRDRAGNSAMASREFDFILDQEPPDLSLATPQDGEVLNSNVLVVAGEVSDPAGVSLLTVNGQWVEVEGGHFSTEVVVAEGVNAVSVAAYDGFWHPSSVELHVVLDTSPPSLELTSPSPGQTTNHSSVRLAGAAQDETGLSVLEVNGAPLANVDGVFDVDLPLGEGDNLLTVRAVDAAGNVGEVSREAFRYTIPSVAIDFPGDLEFVAATVTEVRGHVSDPTAAVSVNGIPAAVSGDSFLASEVPLIEGGNILTAVARTATGRTGTASIQVVRDLSPPIVAVEFPRDGSTVFEPAITVFGMVNDIVAGTVNATEAAVTVNGHSATVSNRSFLVENLPLAVGENRLTVSAVDASGNPSQLSLTVVRAVPTVPRLAVVSGDRQQAVVGESLAGPIVVELLDGAGGPVPGRTVVFKVRGGDGTLAEGLRRVAVSTDASGRAATTLTLGKRAGVGNQRVEASAVGFQGPAVFTVDALAGEPARLVVDAGDQQLGTAGQTLPRPLVAVVTDAGFNRLEGVAVGWSVAKGGGTFASGGHETLAATDSDGRAIVPFIVDKEEGIANNVVEAHIEGVASSESVVFSASGRAAGPDAVATSVSGVVVDNTNIPIAGATLRVLDTTLTAQTDAQGQFRISGAPPGTMRLIVDGSTVDRPGSWPDLEFIVTAIPGRDNPLTRPVYLLSLELGSGVYVDETHGAVLALPGVPGFALEIPPGSVTFPGGGRTGLVSVTAVHSDKVPMVPNFGQQPRLIVTIQPAGARFDPPARLTLPNVEGLRPGEVTELYSFDHDLGHFVSIGPGTVSEDGAVIVSNPGVGVIKAGWHCGGNPAVFGTCNDCPSCQIYNGTGCVPGCPLPAPSEAVPFADDPLRSTPAHLSTVQVVAPATAGPCDCSLRDPCSRGNSCTGSCKPLAAGSGSVTALADGRREGTVKGKGQQVVFSPTDVNVPDCDDLEYEWDFGDGATSNSALAGHAYSAGGHYQAMLTVRCAGCPKTLAEDGVPVTIIALEIQVTAGATQEHVTGDDNWAAVKGEGMVELEAGIIPPDPEAAQQIVWDGATPDPSDRARATVPKSQIGQLTVMAAAGGLTDSVDIWVMWVDLELRSSGTLTPTNGVPRPSGSGFPILGPMTDEDLNLGFTEAEAAGNVEIVGHLQPSGVDEVVREGWKIRRRVTQVVCLNGIYVATRNDADDTSLDQWMDLDLENDDQIYDTDGPTAGTGFSVPHTIEVYDSFVQSAEWNGEIASNSLMWHYQAQVDDDLDVENKPRNRDTILNDVGEGALSMPQECVFQPRP